MTRLIRKANVSDVPIIKELLDGFSSEGLMLQRSLSELYETVRDFYVYEKDGEVIGCCALHVVWEDLAEIKSTAVDREYWRSNIGSRLLKTCLEDARELGVDRVFALTYVPEFFEFHGFERAEKSELPQKVWGECVKCPKFPDCDEILLIRTLP